MASTRAANSIVTTLVLAGVLAGGCSNTGSAEQDRGASRRPPADPGKHNVLLVTLDTTRVDYLSCYDASKGKLTPNLDAIAADGVRFELAIAQSPATPMSHASILTGLNPYQHGVRVIAASAGFRLRPDIPSLAAVLKEQGWTTAAFLSAFTVSEYYGFDHGFDTFDNGLKQEAETILYQEDGRRRWKQRVHQRRSDATTDAALGWLRSPGRRPFFMWVHYWDPHDRMVLPPQTILRRFVSPQMTPNSPPWKRAVYRAEVHYVDTQFARLVQALKVNDEYDRTILLIVADHGQGLGQHDWWAHRLLYQEDLHVPLIVRVPGWPTGRVVTELARTIDVYPTVLEALGLETRPGLPGRSLRSMVAGEPGPPRLAYAEVLNKYDLNSPVTRKRPKDDLVYCAMDRTWKLVYRYTYPGESELYNLADDPQELNNLFDRRPDQVKRLKAILDEHDGYVTAPFGTGVPDADVRRALEELGYVESSDEEDADGTDPNAASIGAPTTAPAEEP